MRHLAKVISAVVLIASQAGCAATVSLAPTADDQQAKTFQISEQHANVYVFRRSQFEGSAILLQIFVDGSVVGAVAPGTYLYLQLEPGEHTVASITQENQSVIRLLASGGKNYFVEAAPAWGFASARAELTEVSEDEDRDEIESLSLALGIN